MSALESSSWNQPANVNRQVAHLSKEELLERYYNLLAYHERYQSDVEKKINMFSHYLDDLIIGKSVAPPQLAPNDPCREMAQKIQQLQQKHGFLFEQLDHANRSLQLAYTQHMRDVYAVKANLRTILDHSDSAVWLVDPEFELIEFNKAYQDIYFSHYRKEVRPGQSVFAHVSDPQLKAIWQQRLNKGFAGESHVYEDHVLLSGQEEITEFKVFPVFEADQVRAVAIYANDLTFRKLQAQLLQQQNDELKKANEELDLFAYSVSHDLRAPLTTVLGLINLMEMAQPQAEIAHLLGLQRKSVEKLDNFITEILHLSRNDRTNVQVDQIIWEELVTDALDRCQSFVQTQAFEEVVNLQQTHIPFFSDPSRLKIIFSNLVHNAFKYALKRDRPSHVGINVQVTPEYALIEISDDGMGIKAEHLESIFDMFYRADDQRSGSGLGLYIVKEALKRIGGNIECQSEYGIGTTFYIRIPNQKTPS